MSDGNAKDPDYSHQKITPLKFEPVNGSSAREVSTQTEHDTYCENGCLSMYIDACHEQETNHSAVSRVNKEDSRRRSNDLEKDSSRPKEFHVKSVQKNDIASSSTDTIIPVQECRTTENDGNTGLHSSTSAMPRELNVLFIRRAEHVEYRQSHAVNVNSHGGTNGVRDSIIEKTYFCVEPTDTRKKENRDSHDVYIENSKHQPAKKPNRIKESSTNELDAREAVHEKSECRESGRVHALVKPYNCKYCNKGFTRQDNLKVHERIHTGVKPYECSYCDKAFARHGSLKEHERTHTGVKPYKCAICNKDFAVESNLKVHERIHTGVKPYKCTICKKEFTVKCSLKKHESIHTGIKPYKCTYCNKGFAVMYSLKEHESVHTGDKPFKCTYCDKAFVRQVRLRKHERIHTGVKPFKCT